MSSLYAIGDIHGQLGMLEDQLAQIDKDSGGDARIVFLGDYVDRGADSKAVIDLFLQARAEGRDWTFIKGNHDRMFQRFIETGQSDDERILSGKLWLHERLGGVDTLNSYLDTAETLRALGAQTTDLTAFGIEQMPKDLLHAFLAALTKAIPQAHRDFLRDLSLSHTERDKFFVHAGVRPGLPLHQQEEDDMLWIREEFLHDDRHHGALVVHGHTPVDAPELRANRLNLDTGAGYGRPLSVAVFEDDDIFHLTPMGRARL
ncbi:metallophosphoesterase [Tropicibacter oceani]|uniref:Metallophosphoesterase n=1 Tax=Tropicibacter oceani TaxID=3058420 RepID=A0ABY8QEP2_9RHOB|nr:metallophosphoesterase [Tropicibacter oceani]WGW03097.1 metallophosphoesterase [Tropicibacter oceani]